MTRSALAVALAAAALFGVVLPLLGRPAALLSAGLFGLACSDPTIQGSIANAELFMLPGLVAATAKGLVRVPLKDADDAASSRRS